MLSCVCENSLVPKCVLKLSVTFFYDYNFVFSFLLWSDFTLELFTTQLYNMKLFDDFGIGKDVKGGDHGLIYGSVMSYAWSN